MHLINDGITYINNTVSIEWGLSGPSDVEQDRTTFTCRLNGGPSFVCKLFHLHNQVAALALN